MTDTDYTFRSPDLYLTAYLIAAGIPLISSEREGHRLYWTLRASKVEIDALTYAWVSGQAQLYAASYAEKIKALKNMAMGGSR